MTLLDPSNPLPESDEPQAPRKPKIIHTSVRAEFPNITPAHERYIVGLGQGTNLRRSVCDALSKIFASPKLKGKKATSTLPAKMTVSLDFVADREDEDA